MAFRTRPRGDQLSFLTECFKCRAEISISNGRVDRHDCEPKPTTLAQIRAALDKRLERDGWTEEMGV